MRQTGRRGFQRLIGNATDQAKRVIAGDPALRAQVAEKSVPPNIVAMVSKPSLARQSDKPSNPIRPRRGMEFFSSLLGMDIFQANPVLTKGSPT